MAGKYHLPLIDTSFLQKKKLFSSRFGIVVSSWNSDITNSLKRAAEKTLLKYKISAKNIYFSSVPGAYELPLGALKLFKKHKLNAVICLGCVIQGDTKHNEYINHAVANGLIQLSLQYQIPFVFGVLTPNNYKQAKERAGGKYGNKGEEAALAAIEMVSSK